VETQLKTLMAEGMATIKVETKSQTRCVPLEHVLPPDQGADGGDGDAGEGDGPVAEDRLAGEDREYLADDPHAGEDHDVDGRVGVDPEEMLEHDRVPPLGGVEHSGAEQPLEDDQRQGDGEHRRGEDLHPGGGVEAPDEEGQPPPAHPFGAQAMNCGDEIDAGQMEEKPRMKTAKTASGTLVVVWVLNGT
jgi:hypothetical protein